MGTQKLLLPLGNETLIGHVVDQVLAAVPSVLVVVGQDGRRIAEALAGRHVTLVTNPDPRSEMLGSLRCGLEALPGDCEAALVVLGDQPGLRTEIIGQVVRAFPSRGKGIVVPVHQGKRGHPTLIAARYFPEIRQRYDGVGLRGLLQAHVEDIHEVPVNDAAILIDVDSPEDYDRLQQ
jgi:molybdenum cofactor cytidylyltransferase